MIATEDAARWCLRSISQGADGWLRDAQSVMRVDGSFAQGPSGQRVARFESRDN